MLEEDFMNRVAEFDPGNEEQMTEKKLDWLKKHSPRNLDFKQCRGSAALAFGNWVQACE